MCTEASQVTGSASALNDIEAPVIHPRHTSFHLLILQQASGPLDHPTIQFNTATQTV